MKLKKNLGYNFFVSFDDSFIKKKKWLYFIQKRLNRSTRGCVKKKSLEQMEISTREIRKIGK
jgi:hypothetical protein